MGADYIDYNLPNASKEDVLRTYEMLVDSAAEAGYSGDWGETSGLKFVSGVEENEFEAREYGKNHAQKWGPALAIAYHTGRSSALTEKINEYNAMVIEQKELIKTAAPAWVSS
ncbi:MAG: hypothetical protein EOO60_05690 [Hymenobacter sp.]|nr:MAG: hypothetical protein EOO60_05690 [Hymenobacter sp.]